ncbi:MAG: 7-cyano-7-deazaguanine synthase [Bacteroidales bacterium]|nr:7-cyano-7-deazaguanine synthase [Bacteroidales bacterium]
MLEPTVSCDWPPNRPPESLAVLVSGGLDSAILLAEAVAVYPRVYPIYVRVGSFWETVEQEYLLRFLTAIATPTLQPLTVLSQPVTDLYGSHWSLSGQDVPGADTPDEAVFLPGRNVLLLAKPLLWCHLHQVPLLATAPLASNPFPDATASFYERLARCVSDAVNGAVRVLRPYAELGLHKSDLLRRGASYPLQWTFSCIRPMQGLHCGRCNKCAERYQGFAAAGLPDPTIYHSHPC